jgi:membrane fusion protein (multidrug efflux system)
MDARTSQQQHQPQEPHEQHIGKSVRHRIADHPYMTAVIAIAVAIVLIATIAWWLHARHFESTDDAFIDARVTQVSSQVGGAIVDVPVTDNQLVDAGAVLVKVDERDYVAALDQANAQIGQAKSRIATVTAQLDAQQALIDQANKQVEQASAAQKFAQEENTRYQDLFKRGAGTQQRAQQATSDLQQRDSALAAGQAAATAAQKQFAVLQAQLNEAKASLAQAQATLEQAQTNLDRTAIRAPVAGRVTKLTAAKGAYAQPGQSLMGFVPRDLWVTANFKETQLTDMRPGQSVDIEIDAYPARSFHGHVDSIQAGSGPAFSLLPPENATGNFVKVVQRVPVKVVFDELPDLALGPGMSVVPTVRVR